MIWTVHRYLAFTLLIVKALFFHIHHIVMWKCLCFILDFIVYLELICVLRHFLPVYWWGGFFQVIICVLCHFIPMYWWVGILQVKFRTSDHNTYRAGSHVMQYGDIPISKEQLFLYIGSDPANANATFTYDNGFPEIPDEKDVRAVNQRDADLLYLWQKVVHWS